MEDRQVDEKARDLALKTMRDSMDKAGISSELLTKKLKKELNAREFKTYNDKGSIVYSKPLIAWDIRQRARQDAHRLRGDYPAEEHKITGDLIEPRSPEERKILQDVAKEVSKRLRDKKTKPW